MVIKKKYTNSDQVYKSLRDYFSRKNFEIGEKIPAERDISLELCVNRTTLRTALQRMVNDGILTRQVGCGTFFKTSPKNLSTSYTRVKTECCPLELVKIRMMLEPQVAGIAATCISSAEIKELRDICSTKNGADPFDIEMADIEFYSKLVRITKNHLLDDLYSVISCARNKDIKKCLENRDFQPLFISQELWLEHQNNLLDALERQNSASASASVHKKLEDIMKLYNY